MKTVEITVYNFDELTDTAKEKAREWYRDGLEYPWFCESIDSIRAFVNHFGVTLTDWSLGGCGSYIHTNATNANFRGVKLADIDRDYMPTGFCFDCDLWQEFYDQFKQTGDAKYSFEQALEAAIREIQRDIDHYFSDECVDEMLMVNDYQFTENGKIF